MAEHDPAHADESAGASDSQETFAARLDRLFKTVYPAGGQPFTNAEVARAIGVSATYIGNLRKGKSDNPTLAQMQALAAIFNVPVAYFVDDDEGQKTREDLELLAKLKDMGVREIAFRTIADMSEDSVTSVLPVLQRLAETTQTARQDGRGRRMSSHPHSTGDDSAALLHPRSPEQP
jgi:transcriptional regulator with XRE-family HTH domain